MLLQLFKGRWAQCKHPQFKKNMFTQQIPSRAFQILCFSTALVIIATTNESKELNGDWLLGETDKCTKSTAVFL